MNEQAPTIMTKLPPTPEQSEHRAGAQEILELALAYTPTSAEDAVSMADMYKGSATHIVSDGTAFRIDGDDITQSTAEELKEAAGQGLNRWILTSDQVEQKQRLAAGDRPDGISFREWFDTTPPEKKSLREQARTELELSKNLKFYQATKRAEKVMAVNESILNTELEHAKAVAYKQARNQTDPGLDAYVDAKLANSMTTGDAREMLKDNLKLRFEADAHKQAAAAADIAAASRRADIDAKGGISKIGAILSEEIKTSHDEGLMMNDEYSRQKEVAEKDAFLRRIYGSDYEKEKAKRAARHGMTSEAVTHEPKDTSVKAERAVEIPKPVKLTTEQATDWDTFSAEQKLHVWNRLDQKLAQNVPAGVDPDKWAQLHPWQRVDIVLQVTAAHNIRSAGEAQKIITQQAAPVGIAQENWDTMTVSDRDEALRVMGAEARQMLGVEKAYQPPRIIDLRPSALRRRINDKFHHAAAIATTRLARAVENTKDTEKFTYRKRVAAGVIGAFAVGVAAGVTMNMLRNGQHAEAQALTEIFPNTDGTPHHAFVEVLKPVPGTEAIPATPDYISATLKKGDNLTKLVQEQLSQGGHQPTNAEINAAVRADAAYNGIDLSKGQDRHMAVGKVIKLLNKFSN